MASAPHCDDFILLSAKVPLHCFCTELLCCQNGPLLTTATLLGAESQHLKVWLSHFLSSQTFNCCNLYNFCLFVCLSVFSFVCFAYVFSPSDQLAVSCSEIFLQDKALLCHVVMPPPVLSAFTAQSVCCC